MTETDLINIMKRAADEVLGSYEQRMIARLEADVDRLVTRKFHELHTREVDQALREVVQDHIGVYVTVKPKEE